MNKTYTIVNFLRKGLYSFDALPHVYCYATDVPIIMYITMVPYFFIGCLFRKFSSFWIEQKPASVMEFNRIREEFRGNVILTLQYPGAVLPVDDPCIKADVDSTSVQSFTSQDFQ